MSTPSGTAPNDAPASAPAETGDRPAPRLLSESLAHALNVAAVVAGGVAVVGAMLFYLGWARTYVFLHLHGVEPSVVPLTTTDYLLRAVSDPLQVTTFFGVVGLLAFPAYFGGRVLARQTSEKAVNFLPWGLAFFGALFLVLGLGGVLDLLVYITPLTAFLIPLSILAGYALLSFALLLWWRSKGRPRIPPPLKVFSSFMVAMSLASCLFWIASKSAEARGIRLASDSRTVKNLKRIALYAKKPRGYEKRAPGVLMKKISSATDFPYRYTGLRLLLHAGDRYLLISEAPPDPAASPPVLMVDLTEDIQIDFDPAP